MQLRFILCSLFLALVACSKQPERRSEGAIADPPDASTTSNASNASSAMGDFGNAGSNMPVPAGADAGAPGSASDPVTGSGGQTGCPSQELCRDGLDNDCDALADEG